MLNRLSSHGLLLALSAALLFPVAGAQAAARERIALHPCVITGNKKASASDLQLACVTAAVRDNIDFVPSTEVNAFFEEEKAKDKPKKGKKKEAAVSCASKKLLKERDACLGRLASTTQAARSLYLSIQFTYVRGALKGTRITGRAVDASGKLIEEKLKDLILSSPIPPEPELVRSAVSQLLDQLETTRPPEPEFIPQSLTDKPIEPDPAPTVAQPTPAAPPLKAEPPPPPRPRGRTWMTPAGIAAGGAGIVGLGVATAFLLGADSKAKDFNQAFAEGNLPTRDELPGLIQLREDGESQRKNGKLIMIAGGALLAAGGALFGIDTALKDKSSTPAAGTTRILAGPHQVGILVLLP
ncbi:hypothetical protein [Stigmatella aurantiaca]|uniref:Uncharacterized protein n=1 Tax=Stigmatella aurantiaca (strain DW4/3-1) TaxID=378806 RepID=Q09BF2_STIAD|nr:hypothetical protein [Stigmatella aurantiaca]ADO69043.1 uncharacterized protein STAUR_1239 [Stigmatella aurantiaca DW4/3-1]EAU69100.1 hypothetical protein STIAU_8647 [Stigmatella aurantiaca DW4/3-1]